MPRRWQPDCRVNEGPAKKFRHRTNWRVGIGLEFGREKVIQHFFARKQQPDDDCDRAVEQFVGELLRI